MSNSQEKITRYMTGKKTQFVSDMAGMLELSDRVFKTPMTKILRVLVDKVDACENRWAM